MTKQRYVKGRKYLKFLLNFCSGHSNGITYIILKLSAEVTRTVVKVQAYISQGGKCSSSCERDMDLRLFFNMMSGNGMNSAELPLKVKSRQKYNEQTQQ